jgi:hypothetical protein
MKDKNFNRISFILNVLLAGTCIMLLFHARSANPSLPASESLASGLPAAKDDTNSRQIGKNAPPVAARRGWVDILRDEGVPEKVLARLVLADFDDRWQARQDEAQQAYNRGDMDADGLAALDLQHEIERENSLRADLGDDAFRQWDQDRLLQQFHLTGLGLTASESNSLYALAANLRQRQRDLTQARQQNQIDQATQNAEQAKARAGFEQQVHALLGDDRYQALHGTDPAVGELRRGLRGLNVNDSQFSTLLETQKKWETVRSQLEQQEVETPDSNLEQKIRDVNESRDQMFEGILGTDGFALFQKEQDSRYVEMQKNAARWGIDDSNIDYIYGEIQSYEKMAKDSESQAHRMEAQGSNVDWDIVRQQMRANGRQMAENIRNKLGETSYDTINRNQILPFANP